MIEVELEAAPRHVLEQADVKAVHSGEPGSLFSLVAANGACSLGSTFLTAEPDPATWVEPLLAAGTRFVPALRDAPVAGTRACARPQSFDGRPLVGEVLGIEGLWVAAGHGPWGISAGPATARLAAGALLGRRRGARGAGGVSLRRQLDDRPALREHQRAPSIAVPRHAASSNAAGDRRYPSTSAPASHAAHPYPHGVRAREPGLRRRRRQHLRRRVEHDDVTAQWAALGAPATSGEQRGREERLGQRQGKERHAGHGGDRAELDRR